MIERSEGIPQSETYNDQQKEAILRLPPLYSQLNEAEERLAKAKQMKRKFLIESWKKESVFQQQKEAIVTAREQELAEVQSQIYGAVERARNLEVIDPYDVATKIDPALAQDPAESAHFRKKILGAYSEALANQSKQNEATKAAAEQPPTSEAAAEEHDDLGIELQGEPKPVGVRPGQPEPPRDVEGERLDVDLEKEEVDRKPEGTPAGEEEGKEEEIKIKLGEPAKAPETTEPPIKPGPPLVGPNGEPLKPPKVDAEGKPLPPPPLVPPPPEAHPKPAPPPEKAPPPPEAGKPLEAKPGEKPEEKKAETEKAPTEKETDEAKKRLAAAVEKLNPETQTMVKTALEVNEREKKRIDERYGDQKTLFNRAKKWFGESWLGRFVGGALKLGQGFAETAAAGMLSGTPGLLLSPALFAHGTYKEIEGGLQMLGAFGEISADRKIAASNREVEKLTKDLEKAIDEFGGKNKDKEYPRIRELAEQIRAEEAKKLDAQAGRFSLRAKLNAYNLVGGIAGAGTRALVAGLPTGIQNFGGMGLKLAPEYARMLTPGHSTAFDLTKGWMFGYKPGELGILHQAGVTGFETKTIGLAGATGHGMGAAALGTKLALGGGLALAGAAIYVEAARNRKEVARIEDWAKKLKAEAGEISTDPFGEKKKAEEEARKKDEEAKKKAAEETAKKATAAGPQPPDQGSREPTLPEGGKGVGADEGEGKTEPGKPGKSEEEKSPEEKELDELKKNNPHEVFLRKQIDNNEFEAEVLGVNRKLVFENLSEKIKPAEGENWQTEVLNGREKDNVILEVRGIRKVEKGDWVPKTKEINWKEKGESGWEIGGSDQKTEDEKEKSAVVAVARDPFGKDAVWLPKSRKEKIFAEDWRKPGSRRHYFELDPKSEFIVFNPRKIETGDVMVTIEETGGKKRILNTGIDALVNVFDLKAIEECANVDIRRRAEETLGATIRRIKEAQLASPGKEEEHQSLEEAMADRIKATDRGREWPEGPTTEGERETPPAPEPSQEPPVGEEPLPPPPAEPIASSVPPPIKQPIGADTAEEPELEEKPPKNIGAVVEEPGSEQPEATVAGPTSYEVEIGGKKVEIGPGNTLEIKIPGQPEVTDVVKEYIPDPEGDTSKVAFGLETGQAARFDKDQLRQLLERGNITVS